MNSDLMENRLLCALRAALQAGKAILEIYHSDFSVIQKADNSPLTLADQKSHDIIVTALGPFGFPILSEEGKDIPYAERKEWETFWLVDPLDGTKEFIKRNDEFTVNIALIQKGVPVMGVIFAPALGTIYFGENAIGAYKIDDPFLIGRIQSFSSDFSLPEWLEIQACSSRLPLGRPKSDTCVIVGSRSHGTPELETFVDQKRGEFAEVSFVPAGSSLKFCLVAEGRASIYPRLGPTMEWDTAAGQAIACCAGANVVRYDTGESFRYNKECLINPSFIVTVFANDQ